MSLTDILNEAVERVHGVQLAGIISTDGLGVEMVLGSEEYDREAVELELGALASNAAMTANRMGAGMVRDIVLEAEAYTYLASLITPGYYAVLGIESNGNLGRARFAIHQMVHRLQNEL